MPFEGAIDVEPGRPSGEPAEADGDLLADLNPAQRGAVTHPGGPLLLLAGPGSGKTRVITRRIAWLVREAGVRPHEVLAITFTNKAAGEMRARVESLLDARGLWIGTFHATCARILRREIELLEGPWTRDFTILDTSDKNQLVKRLISDLGYDATRFRPAVLGAWISAGKNRAVASGDRQADLAGDAAEEDERGIEGEVFARVRERYAAALRDRNAVDFDDLLLHVVRLFDEQPGLRDAYAERFRHVLVDEYQDTNRVQYLLVRHLASRHGNLCVCGDPDQSIYGWRGADLRNILDFERDFPGACEVRLEQNYRSTNRILRAAQALIDRNVARKPKRIWSELGEGEKLALLRCADENDEAREVAAQVRALIERGARPDAIAMFYRVNFMQRALESALRLARLPYRVVAGTEFYARREIKDLLAYLRLVVNPADDLAFERAVGAPSRGVGARTLELLRGWAADRRVPLARALESEEALSLARGRARRGLVDFRELLATLAARRDGPAADALRAVLSLIDAQAWYAEMDDGDALDREANVEELVAHAATYDALAAGEEGALGGVRGFLQEIALVSDVDTLDDPQGKVSLMTLHAAKGLEFRHVFVCGCEEELLPHARALDEAGPGWAQDGVEEERRLFFVGMTRARERLFLTWAERRMHFGQTSACLPSRFLTEIPPDLVEGALPEDEDEGLGSYEPDEDVAQLAVGDRVEHAHFGRGTVEALTGSGINARATVRFAAHGTKLLLLQYARLQVVGRPR